MSSFLKNRKCSYIRVLDLVGPSFDMKRLLQFYFRQKQVLAVFIVKFQR